MSDTFYTALEHALMERKGEKHGPEIRFLCPAHDDHNPSADYNTVKHSYICRSCGAKGGALELADLVNVHRPVRSSGGVIQEIYDYVDEQGAELFQVVRLLQNGKKTFRQRHHNPQHPKAKKDGWAWTLEGVRRVLYRLPAVLETTKQSHTVFIVEGEKDVATLEEWGLTATCNPAGAGKWRLEYSESLRGADVVILPDNDSVGQQHAAQVGKSLEKLAKTIRVLELPGLSDKGDVSDWKAQGGTLEEFKALLEQAKPFLLELEPQPESKQAKENDDDEDEESSKKKPASTRLLEHTEAAGVELWHDTDQNPYMSVPERRDDGSSGRLTFRLPSSKARSWLEGLFYRTEHKAIAAMAIQEALGVLKSKAIFDGETYPAGVRILALEGVVYLDLGTPGLEVVEINKGGWIVRSSLEIPVRFWRPAGLKALPIPTKSGNLEDLKQFLNTDEPGFVLVTAWLTAALSGRKPYPILAFSGEQGTGKSTASRVCRDLLDPNTAGLRSAPKNERDLFISAKNGHVLSFENLSVIGPELSDSMCRMATGGGFATRTLYADDEESLFDAARPIVLNGIPELATRPDLADRTLSATLKLISDANRMDEATFWAEFEAARAGILGALCTAVSTYLRNWDTTKLALKPRMADFARLVVAAESALPWKPGEFLSHYSAARADLAASTLEGDDVARGVALILEQRGKVEWRGTGDKLHGELKAVLKFEERTPKSFPANARALSTHLTRIAPALRQTDIVVEKERTNSKRAVILRHLRHAPQSGEGKTPSETDSKGGDAKGDAKLQGGRTDEGKTPSGTTQKGGDANRDANLGGDAKGDANGISDAKVTQEKMFASPIETPSQTTRLGFAEGPVTQVTQNLPRSTSAKVKRIYDGGDADA